MNRLPAKKPDVVFKQVTDGAVLLSTKDEVYFGLDPVGAQIWELLPPVHDTIDALSEALAARYPDVGVETIRSDAVELLSAMLEAGLLVASDDADEADRGEADPA